MIAILLILFSVNFVIFHWYHAVPQELFQFVDLHVSYPGAYTSALLLRCSGVAAAAQQAVTDGLSEWQPPEQTHTHTHHTHVCACINMHEPCTHAPGCYLGKKDLYINQKYMSFVLSEINIMRKRGLGWTDGLITSVCVLVFSEEDAGKAAGCGPVSGIIMRLHTFVLFQPSRSLELFTCSRAHWKNRRGDCWLWAH